MFYQKIIEIRLVHGLIISYVAIKYVLMLILLAMDKMTVEILVMKISVVSIYLNITNFLTLY